MNKIILLSLIGLFSFSGVARADNEASCKTAAQRYLLLLKNEVDAYLSSRETPSYQEIAKILNQRRDGQQAAINMDRYALEDKKHPLDYRQTQIRKTHLEDALSRQKTAEENVDLEGEACPGLIFSKDRTEVFVIDPKDKSAAIVKRKAGEPFENLLHANQKPDPSKPGPDQGREIYLRSQQLRFQTQ